MVDLRIQMVWTTGKHDTEFVGLFQISNRLFTLLLNVRFDCICLCISSLNRIVYFFLCDVCIFREFTQQTIL